MKKLIKRIVYYLLIIVSPISGTVAAFIWLYELLESAFQAAFLSIIIGVLALVVIRSILGALHLRPEAGDDVMMDAYEPPDSDID